MYVSDRYGYYHKVLGKLNIRACVPTRDERKQAKVLMEQGFYDDYKDFLQFQSPDPAILEALATVIFMYNKTVKH
jgi:hypothetical protein